MLKVEVLQRKGSIEKPLTLYALLGSTETCLLTSGYYDCPCAGKWNESQCYQQYKEQCYYVQIVATIHLHYTELLSALTRDGKSSMHSFLCILKKGLSYIYFSYKTYLFLILPYFIENAIVATCLILQSSKSSMVVPIASITVVGAITE